MKLIKKFLLGLILVLASCGLIGWIYFTAGEETYPDGLSTGEKAPAFLGYDQFGNRLQLDSLITDSKLVLIFYRGTWCPICNKHISELQDSLDLVIRKGAKVVAITPEKPEFDGADNFKEQVRIPLIHDEDLKIMVDDYDVAYNLSRGSQRVFGMAGLDFTEINSQPLNVLPIPAVYVIGQNGIIEFAWVKNGGLKVDYASVADLISHL